MKRYSLTIYRWFHLGLMISMLAIFALPAVAQDNTGSTSGTTTTTETTTSSSFISDYGIWLLVGAVVVIALIIALTRGRGGSNTTVVK